MVWEKTGHRSRIPVIQVSCLLLSLKLDNLLLQLKGEHMLPEEELESTGLCVRAGPAGLADRKSSQKSYLKL